MGEAVNGVTQAAQVDKRIILAIIKALARVRRLVVPLKVVEEELDKMIGDGDDLEEKLEEELEMQGVLYDAIKAGVIKYAYLFEDRVVFSLHELSSEQLQILEEIAQLYNFLGYDTHSGPKDTYRQMAEVDNFIHNMVKFWNDPCNGLTRPAEVAYRLAVDYGLNVKEVGTSPFVGSIKYITYSIEDSILVGKLPLECVCGRKVWACESWNFVEPSEPQNNTQG